MLQKIHRITSALTACMMAAVCVVSVQSETPVSAAEKKMLVLGDSISAGYGLAEGSFGYYDYVAEYGGYSMTNLAVSGATTTDLLDVIAKEDTRKAVKDADLICISIGANDLLTPVKEFIKEKNLQKEGESLTDMAKRLQKEGSLVSLVVSMNSKLRPYISTAKSNFLKIESELRTLNGDTDIIMQTLYNPVDSYTTTYQGEDLSGDYDTLRSFVVGTLQKLNDPIKELETFKCADVFSAFDGTGWIYVNTLKKDVHPTPLGHALIGATILDVLGVKNNKPTMMFDTVAALSKDDFAAIASDDFKCMMAYCPVAFGDIDADGAVTADDANAALIHYLYSVMEIPSELTANQLARAAVCRNKTVTADDANAILNYFLADFMGSDTSWKNFI